MAPYFPANNVRLDLIAALHECIGTVFFLLFAFGGIQAAAFSNTASQAAAAADTGASAINTVASIEQLLFIAFSMGFSLLVAVWIFYRVTGGMFNPAVATAIFLVGGISPLRWALYCLCELLGAIIASAVLEALVPGPLVVGVNPGMDVNRAQALFIEMFLTAGLVLTVLMLAAEKHRSTPVAPIGIGFALFAGHLWGVVYTGAAMNTARAFGPAVVTGRFGTAHWVYWLGPFLGSLLATAIYAVLKQIEYERLNPDQDTADAALSPAKPLDSVPLPRKSTAIERSPPPSPTFAPGEAAPTAGLGRQVTREPKRSDATMV